MEKTLIILRGIPGSGKTTFADYFAGLTDSNAFAADDYFYDGKGNYNFDLNGLHMAHVTCQSNVRKAMEANEHVITVHNTSTTEKEINPYMKMANELGYRVFSLVVENRHKGENTHKVPDEAIERMKNRFSLKL